MDLKFLSKLFDVGPRAKVTIKLSVRIINALQILIERNPKLNTSDIINDVLDQFLTEAVKAGHLETPADKDAISSTKAEGA